MGLGRGGGPASKGEVLERLLDSLGASLRVVLAWEPLTPPLGLALEDLYMDTASPLLLVWRHSHSVIVGRSTVLDVEVDCGSARALGIPVYRRMSGGGAVYHDPGNINFSLILPGRVYPDILYAAGTGLILELLRSLGVQAWVENEADIVVDGWKVSGGASRIRRKTSMYHATLLVNADTSMLHAVIRPRLDLVQRGVVTPAKYRPRNLSSMLPWITTRTIYKAIHGTALALGWPVLPAAPLEASSLVSRYERQC